MEIKIDQRRLDSIVNQLFKTLSDIKHPIPSVLPKSPTAFTLLTNRYFLLAFLDDVVKKKIKQYMKEGNHPFPGLIAPEYGTFKSAFKLDNTRNAIFDCNKVKNMFSFSLGNDSTLIIYDHNVFINTEAFGNFDYTVPLAYLLSFGTEISRENFYDYLEDLIEFSFMHWRSRDV